MKTIRSIFIAALSLFFYGNASAQAINEKNVVFKSKADSITIGATISSPVKAGKYPAVIIVSGTGPQDRDGTMAGTKMFSRIANLLTPKGYVVLRMDDRGVGKTTGEYRYATTADFALDVLGALQFLKTQKNVDLRHIGLLGHSEGGAVISIAASQSKDVAFLISLSGLASNGLESLLIQNENLVNTSPLTVEDKKRSNEINRLMFATAFQYAKSDSMESKLNTVYSYWKQKDDLYFKSLGIEYDHFRFPIYSYVRQAIGPWYRYFISYDPQIFLSKVDVPILAINGSKDVFVDPINLTYWKKYSRAGQHGKVTTILLPNVNHLLQPCQTCLPAEYAKLGEIPDSTLGSIAKWLKENVK
ncbi:alpha/beta fold hydrolase [Sphingobacterium sp. 2149]|uniref:alpha/beta hydrolase family protein n=1 Tax=Sphingobacterium sp. 2149 TaxID=2817763 RepID=UPI001B5D818C|nr:alpha/beta fold hydrolase [Sphingobacterium sp. 2149]MDR6734450.1 pimeloyl-ACP methyl ester carboxylesterase [Sphingobacterium sp. 2149]